MIGTNDALNQDMRLHTLRPAWLLAGSLFAVSCAATFNQQPARVDDAQLARLPPAERETLINQQRGVDVASSNVETAKVALQDAEKFRSVVGSERDAAENRLAAAQKSADLQGRTADGKTAADDEVAQATRRRDAVNAKIQY